jgi:hypothetical protein
MGTESNWRKVFSIIVATPPIGQECARLCCSIKLVLALCLGHAIMWACKYQCRVELNACKSQHRVENASYLGVQGSLD